MILDAIFTEVGVFADITGPSNAFNEAKMRILTSTAVTVIDNTVVKSYALGSLLFERTLKIKQRRIQLRA